jgi:uncharacterized protein (TIGR03437 family)
MRNRRSAALACLPLALAVWPQPIVADGPSALPSPAVAVRQAFSPFGMALTRDGRYAYLSSDLYPLVHKVRLGDMTIVASADFSRYFPLQCQTIVLDAGEAKVFLFDHTLGRVLVLDAATLQEIRMIGGFGNGTAQLVRSRWGPYLILSSGRGWLINTDTLEVTPLAISRGFNFIRESATDAALWYAVVYRSSGADVGIYNYKTAQWTVKATVSWTPPVALMDFAVIPDGSKAYLAVLGPWYPDYHAAGWVYAVDLQKGTVQQVPVDGGAMSLAASSDSRRVYIGAGWPSPRSNVIQMLDTQTDGPVTVFPIAPQKFGSYSTQINRLELDPVSGQWLYATSSDGNDLLQLDSATGVATSVMVLNNETNSPFSFVREPGTSRGYVLLAGTNEALEVDLDSGAVVRTVQFPLTRTDFRTFGAAFRDANTLLVAQGEYILELAADLTLRARHNLPSGTPSTWGVQGARDGKTLYSVSQARGIQNYQPNLLVAIDAVSFQVKATLQLDGGSFNLPWEHPATGKLYVLGGMQNGAVLVHVIDAQSLGLLKTIRLDDPVLRGISAGPVYPYAYDPQSRVLFVGATKVVLAIDTDRDQIKSVIRLDQISTAIGLGPNGMSVEWAYGLVYHPLQNYLYIAHLHGSVMSVYDLSQGRFLSTLIAYSGYMIGAVFANDDASKIFVAHSRSDSISVLDAKAMKEIKAIDIHACNPFPDSVQFQAGGKTSQTVTLSGLKSTGACTVSTSAGWLSATPVAGAVPPTFNVTADASVFGAGTYQGTVTFQSASLSVSSLDVGLKVGSGVSSVQIAGVADGAGFGSVIAPGAWASVTGSNLAPATRIWRPEEIVEGVLPINVEGTEVRVNGRSAAVYAVGPSQINFQVPDGLTDGAVQVQVVNSGAPSNTISASLRQRVPELFRFLPSAYAVALHTNYRIAARPDQFPGCTDATLCPASEAAPGETILLYGTGLGATSPASRVGTAIGAPVPVSGAVQVRFGNTTVDALAWLVSAGLYQINVKVPDAQPDGDIPLVVSIGGTASAAKAQLTVRRPK